MDEGTAQRDIDEHRTYVVLAVSERKGDLVTHLDSWISSPLVHGPH